VGEGLRDGVIFGVLVRQLVELLLRHVFLNKRPVVSRQSSVGFGGVPACEFSRHVLVSQNAEADVVRNVLFVRVVFESVTIRSHNKAEKDSQ